MGGQDVKQREYIRKRQVLERKKEEGEGSKNRKGTKRTLREKSKQCVFLYNIGLLGQAWIKTFTPHIL